MRTHWLVAALTGLLVAGSPLMPAAAAASTAPGARPATMAAAAATPTVRYGDHGAAVTRLQQRLVALHYDVGAVDGQFGYNTLHAVYAFQKVQRIGVDGVAGPVTWGRLAKPLVPAARHRLATAAVEIDLTRRVVYLT